MSKNREHYAHCRDLVRIKRLTHCSHTTYKLHFELRTKQAMVLCRSRLKCCSEAEWRALRPVRSSAFYSSTVDRANSSGPLRSPQLFFPVVLLTRTVRHRFTRDR